MDKFEDGEQREDAIRSDHDERWKTDSKGVVGNPTQSVESNRNRGNIRVFEEGLDSSRHKHSLDSERYRREAESERLVTIAKEHRLFISFDQTEQLGEKYPKRTGESVVYRNIEQDKVYKIKNPYAKAAIKSGVQPEDVIFEHQIHNLLFPKTKYTLEGISEEYGDARLVLSQSYIPSISLPKQKQIAETLAKHGLYPEDNYSFGNDLVSITDVEGDNVLLGENGELYFIDPIIRFKQPAESIIKTLTKQSK